jgi:hypothetical protein
VAPPNPITTTSAPISQPTVKRPPSVRNMKL